ncbi:MAG: arabinofuranosidase catalytic domain-containing protein [Chitinispirillaceae bacterium]
MLAVMLSLFFAQEKIHAAKCPCDIYAAGGTPCVAAHSTVRALYASYNGPLYQVKRLSDGQTKDIGVLTTGGVANAAAQDSFLNGKTGTILTIYDQSPNGNHLKSRCSGYWVPADTEAVATDAPIKINGHTVYGVYTYMGWSPSAGTGYRNDKATGLATGDQPEGMYMVCSGTHYNQWCCFDYGNAEKNDTDDGNATMECIYFGNSTQWGHGSGTGPWVMADLENGMSAGAAQIDSTNTPIVANYVTAIVKGKTGNWYSIRAGNAQSGKLETKYAGTRPTGWHPMYKQGAIILGIGGDNSHTGIGTFFEGAITTGCPPDSTEDSVQANIVAAGYGRTTTSALYSARDATAASMFQIHYNPTNGNAVISYVLQDARRVSMNVFDQQGRRVAAIVNGVIAAGRHEAVWDAKRVPAGVYVCRTAIDGMEGWTGKIVIGK